jgi:DNA primase
MTMSECARWAVRANEIIKKIDIVDYISRFVKLHATSGKYLRGNCPFNVKCPENSFTVSPEKPIFYCFGCHIGGDLISFVCKYNKFSPMDSLQLLEAIDMNKEPYHKELLNEQLEDELQIINTTINELIMDSIDVLETTKSTIDILQGIQSRVATLYANVHKANNPDEQ